MIVTHLRPIKIRVDESAQDHIQQVSEDIHCGLRGDGSKNKELHLLYEGKADIRARVL